MDKLQGFDCTLHKNRKATYLLIDQEDINLFKCSYCLVEQNISPQKLIFLQDVLDNQDSDKIIDNWPPNLSKDMLNSLNDVASSNLQLQILKDINQFFDELQNDIVSLLQETKKKFVLHINQLENLEKCSRQTYQDISQFKKLQQILLNEQKDKTQISTELKTFYKEMIDISQENQDKLQKSLASFDAKYKRIQLEQLKGIKNMVLSLLKKITIKDQEENQQNQINNNQEQQTLSQIPQNNQKQIIESEDLNFQEIIDISFSIFENYDNTVLNQTLLIKNIQSEFYKLNEQVQENQKIIQLDKSFENNSIEKIITLLKAQTNEFTNLIQQKKDFNVHKSIQLLLEKKFQKQERSNSQYIINRLHQDTKIFAQLNIQKLINDYPIFDINNPNKIIPITFQLLHDKDDNYFSLFQAFNWRFKQYRHLLNTENKTFLVKSDFYFDNNKRYIIRFKFNMPFAKMNTIQIGLLHQNQQNSNQSLTHYIGSSGQSNQSQPKKGQLLNSIFSTRYEEINEIEMRVFINENILIFTDFPHYKNVNDIYSQFDQTLQWYLGIYTTGEGNKVITIQEILEVDEFSKLY